MKLKDGFILGEITGECVVLPSGNNLDLSKMTTLNATGKFIWERLEKETTEEEIVDEILKQYEIGREEAASYVADFVGKLRSYGFLEDR